MPKISVILKNKTLMEGKEENFVDTSSPKMWNWSYPVALKKINEMHFGCDHFDNDNIKYGLFSSPLMNPNDVIAGMEVEMLSGEECGIKDIKEVPVVHMISTEEKERNKGNAKLLYEAVLNRHGILISDGNLYTDEDKTNKSLGLWLNYLPTKGSVVCFNMEEKEFIPFSLQESRENENMRFAVIKDLSIFTESLASKLRSGALAAGIAGMSVLNPAGAADAPKTQDANFKQYYHEPQKIDKIEDHWQDLQQYIETNEGRSTETYTDTEGHPTVGVGFNLDRGDAHHICKQLNISYKDLKEGKVSLTDDQINKIFNHDTHKAIDNARSLVSNFNEQPIQVQVIIVDMAFNLGFSKFNNFDTFLTLIEKGEYEKAAKDLLHTDWYKQTKNRAKRTVDILTSIKK